MHRAVLQQSAGIINDVPLHWRWLMIFTLTVGHAVPRLARPDAAEDELVRPVGEVRPRLIPERLIIRRRAHELQRCEPVARGAPPAA